MLSIYRTLLALYPLDYRKQFGDEMVDVFLNVHKETGRKSLFQQGAFYVREFAGMVSGALREHLRSMGANTGLYGRRFTMRHGFRFPKATAILMLVILAGVALAMEKARLIQVSYSNGNPPVVPLEAARFTFFPTLALLLVIFYALGIIGWAVLFALRRSGVHRLDEIAADRK